MIFYLLKFSSSNLQHVYNTVITFCIYFFCSSTLFIHSFAYKQSFSFVHVSLPSLFFIIVTIFLCLFSSWYLVISSHLNLIFLSTLRCVTVWLSVSNYFVSPSFSFKSLDLSFPLWLLFLFSSIYLCKYFNLYVSIATPFSSYCFLIFLLVYITLSISHISKVDTWLTEFWIDRIRVVLQKGYILYV